MINTRQNTAALYCRLSQDDGGDAESNSISTQRMMLQKYSGEQGFDIFGEYIDDGVSGTTFERESFKRMIADVEDGKIGIILCKDLSRLGRNNAMVAFYTEIFLPDHDVRLICINDGIDTDKGENEIMAFKSVINEYYARDISKKVRSAKRVRAQNGEYSAYVAPFGYRKDPKNKHRLIVDDDAAKTVRYIFSLAAQGNGLRQIAKRLNAEGIHTIRQYSAETDENFADGLKPKLRPVWGTASVRGILKNRTYLGSVINGRTTFKSFKNKTVVKIPEDQWIEIPNMHEALIDMDTFEVAQKILKVKAREVMRHENIFVGVIKCPDCGCSLSLDRRYDKKRGVKVYDFFMCNRYRSRTIGINIRECTSHYTPFSLVYDTLLDSIRDITARAAKSETEYTEFLQRVTGQSKQESVRQAQSDAARLSKRNNELDMIIARMYEDCALGSIPTERFQAMSALYEKEQADVREKLKKAKQVIDSQNSAQENAVRFLDMARKYTDATTLTRRMIVELVDKIVVHQGAGRGRNRTQRIDIYYRFIGMINTQNIDSL